MRDLEDAAESYPGAIWPGQIAEALRGLIHAANLARDQGLAAVPAELTAEHLTLFRRGVAVGLSQVRRVPGAKTKQPPARTLLECLRHREADVLRFLTDTAIPPTSNQAERDLRPSKTRRVAPARCRAGAPSAPCMRLVGAHGASKPRGRCHRCRSSVAVRAPVARRQQYACIRRR